MRALELTGRRNDSILFNTADEINFDTHFLNTSAFTNPMFSNGSYLVESRVEASGFDGVGRQDRPAIHPRGRLILFQWLLKFCPKLWLIWAPAHTSLYHI